MKSKVWLAFSLLLVLSLALAGCGHKITAEEIVAKVQEMAQNTHDAHAVVTGSVDIQGIQVSAKAEIWEQSPNRLRAEVLESSEPRYAGMVMVSDGQQAWLYQPARNQVTVGAVGSLKLPLPPEMLTELQGIIQQMLDASNVELVGEEVVTDLEAYKLTLSPREDAEQSFFPGGGTATLWVDKEQWMILKATYEAGTFGQGSMEVQSFELNPGLSDELFTFQVPEGAKVVDVEAQQPEHLSLDEAKAQAGFPLLVPDYVPEGATLVDVLKTGDSIILYYDHSPQVSFSLIQGAAWTDPLPIGQSQEVTVRGQAATVITEEAHGNTFLYWTENDGVIVIAGHIGLDEALKVAESLK
jgi:outer membrane lipoprotein-sorting protein